jgi:hypothetical protein
MDALSTAAANWRKPGAPAGLLCREWIATPGKSLPWKSRARFAEVGSFYPRRENFRLTDEVKATFTEKGTGVTAPGGP